MNKNMAERSSPGQLAKKIMKEDYKSINTLPLDTRACCCDNIR